MLFFWVVTPCGLKADTNVSEKHRLLSPSALKTEMGGQYYAPADLPPRKEPSVSITVGHYYYQVIGCEKI
jgi:hypothetical protein